MTPGRHTPHRILLDGRKPIPATILISQYQRPKGKKK